MQKTNVTLKQAKAGGWPRIKSRRRTSANQLLQTSGDASF